MGRRSDRLSTWSALALALATVPSAAVIVTAQQRGDTASGATSPPVVLTGCVERSPHDAAAFLLRVGTSSPAYTTAAAGTSATGDAPSGQVTGQTPTGATATATATPTPAVGTPEATANPASPTYNRPAGDPHDTVSTTDTSARTGVALYRLAALGGVALDGHVGRLVEVRGSLASASAGTDACCAGLQGPPASAHEPEAKPPHDGSAGTSGTTGRPTPTTSIPTFTVTAVTEIASTCSR